MTYYRRWLSMFAVLLLPLIAGPAAAVLVTVPCDAPYVNAMDVSYGSESATFPVTDFSPLNEYLQVVGEGDAQFFVDHRPDDGRYFQFISVNFNASTYIGSPTTVTGDAYQRYVHCFEVADEVFSYDIENLGGRTLAAYFSAGDVGGAVAAYVSAEYTITDITAGSTVSFARFEAGDAAEGYVDVSLLSGGSTMSMGPTSGFLTVGRQYRFEASNRVTRSPVSDLEVGFAVSEAPGAYSFATVDSGVPMIPVPEPGTVAMLSAGILGLLYLERRHRIDNE